MGKKTQNCLADLTLLLIVIIFLISGPVLAQVTIYTDETAYLNALSAGGYVSFQEGFEDNTIWGGARAFNTAYSVVSRGIIWTSNHTDAINQPSHISTSSGAARTGMWGIYSYPHGDPDALGSSALCNVTDPPSYCFKKDGFMGTRESETGILYGVGGWITGTFGGKIIIILDGNESVPVDFGDLGMITNTHKFFGVIDTQGFTKFEFRETEGKIGDEKFIFADDFTFAILSCWDNDSDGYEDEICGGNDCDDADPNMHPGAAEVYDGKDNDCDGNIDESEAVLNLPKGWSMVSLPIIPIVKKVPDVFPGAVVVYGFRKETGYVRVTEQEDLEAGKGYWILLHEANDFILTGQTIPYYSFSLNQAGWHMIGGCTSEAKASCNNCNIAVIYGFTPGTGYQRILETENLEPGKGYWILFKNVTEQCIISINSI